MCLELRRRKYRAEPFRDVFTLPNGEELLLDYMWTYRRPDAYKYGSGTQGFTWKEIRELKRARKEGLEAAKNTKEAKGREDLKRLEQMLEEL